MNSQLTSNKAFKAALISFLIAGLLAIMLLASLGTSWGVAYGQSAGPTNTPTDVCATTPPDDDDGGDDGDGGNNGQIDPRCVTPMPPTAQPSAVDNITRKPTTVSSAVSDANQKPIGVVPGLPNTGTGSASTEDSSWKLIVLGLLLANMLIAALVMRRNSKSSRSR